MSSRVYLVCGLAEVWTCAALRASLESNNSTDIVVLYGHPVSMPDSLRKDTLRLAHAFFPWTRVVDAVAMTPSLVANDPSMVKNAVALLRECMGLNQCDAIFTHTLDKKAEQAILLAYPEAQIYLFDNGLASHLDKMTYPGSPDPARSGSVPESLLSRVAAAYFTLLGELPIPRFLARTYCAGISQAHLLDVARKALLTEPDTLELTDRQPSTLILGTSFYRSKMITFEQEKSVYITLLRWLEDSGVSSVIFKEHPRSNREPLIEATNRVRHIESRMPVELWPLLIPIEASYSISSTALLTLKKLFGIPGYTLGRELPLATKLSHVKLAHAAVPNYQFEKGAA